MFHGLPVEDVTIVSGAVIGQPPSSVLLNSATDLYSGFFESLVSAYNVSGFVLQRCLRVALRFLRLTSLHLV